MMDASEQAAGQQDQPALQSDSFSIVPAQSAPSLRSTSFSLVPTDGERVTSDSFQIVPSNPVPANAYAQRVLTVPGTATPSATLSAAPAPGMLERLHQGVANSFVGRNLETYVPGVASALHLEPTESESARAEDESTLPEALQYHPIQSAKEIGTGVKNLAESGVIGAAPSVPGTMEPPIPKDPSFDKAALGATQVMSGVMGATKPLIPIAVAQAPIRVALMYGAGILAGDSAEAVSAKLGATPHEQEFAKTLFFFLPDMAVKMAGVKGAVEAMPANSSGQTGGGRFEAQAFGGRVRGVAETSPEAVGLGIKVGPWEAKFIKQRGMGVNVSDQTPAGLPSEQGTRPQAPPDGAALVSQQQQAAVAEVAARAAGTEHLAGAIAGINPAPPPPPKPGEAGSKQTPAPSGMDDGHLSPETSGMLAKAIKLLPPKLQPQAILESVGSLTKWIRSKGTVVGPDGKIQAVTGQSPQSQDQSAHTIAVKMTNDAIEAHQAATEEDAKQQQENAETVQQEQESALQGKSVTAESPAKGEETEKPEIPNTPPVEKAREALRQAPPNATAEDLDKAVRSAAMVTMPVRKALVDAEVARRANSKEQVAETAMNGKPPEPGQSREELQAWSDAVVKGEHPFVHIPQDSSFVPAGIENSVSSGDLLRTKVKGAGAFSGTYYHSSDVSAADIRKAARDKKDPQAALDKITAEFAGKQSPVELQPEEVEQGSPAVSSEAAPVEQAGNRQESESDALDKELETLQPEISEHAKEPESKPIPPEVHKGLADIVEEHAADDPTATLDSVLSDPQDGKIIAEALVNDGIITNSAMNPETAILTTKTRKGLTTAVLGQVFGDELMKQTPDFVREKLSGILGTWGIIHAAQDQWSLEKPMLSAIDLFNRAYRSEDVDTSNPVADALMKKLDGPIDELRKAVSNYAIVADSNRDNYAPEGEADKPYLAFNIAFGTELTEEQYQKAIEGIEKPETSAKSAEPQGEILPPEPKPIAVGDQVSYTTNKGKTRKGEVKWTDGKKVRIQDGSSPVTKNVAEVKGIGEETPAASPLSGRDAVLPNETPAQEAKPEVAADRTLVDHLHGAIEDGRGPRNYNELKKLVAEYDKADPNQLRMKEAQEAFEAAQNRAASQRISAVAYTKGSIPALYGELVRMYEGQPNLAIRTSTSVQNQAYSTPIPLAFIADRFAGIDRTTSVYEPTAGTGNLLISADAWKVTANELDQFRADILKAEGFAVTRNDATTWAPTERFDAVVANPPFAKLPGPVKVDGYNIVKLEHLIVAKALGTMKDAGKAAFIIAAGDREKPGVVTNEQKPFWNWLYSHYNVVSDFEAAGDLYSRQGASYPVRVVAIDGRVTSAKVSPLPDAIPRFNTWGEIYEHASEHLGSDLLGRGRTSDEPGRSQRPETADQGKLPGVSAGGSGRTDLVQPEESGQGDGGSERPANKPQPVQHTGRVPDPGVGSPDITVRSDGDVAQSDRLAEGQSAPKAVTRKSPKPDGHSANALVPETSNEYQATYHPYSEKKDVMVMAPKALITPMQEALARVADDVGDLDEFVAAELGYDTVEDMHEALMGTQVDGIALALHNIQKGRAIIIADQTGLGKGRQAAAIVRWSELHGHIPIFMTAGATLFSDIHRDLQDIGSEKAIRPLIFNEDGKVIDQITEEVLLKNSGAMGPVFDRIMETGQLPKGNNAVYVTYSQISKANKQQGALMRLAPNAIFVLDESHTAAGRDSNTGQYLQGVLTSSRGVMFLSATWAKRPDNLGIYAAMTDLSIAIPDLDKIEEVFAKGGVPLQTVATYQLAQSGQFVRRERSFDGITFEPKVDEDHAEQHEKIADDVTEILRAIVAADTAYHNFDFAEVQKELEKQGMVGKQKTVVVDHHEFASTVHNSVKTLLLALKADVAADEMIRSIESGEKPIFALENTMGSFLESYIDSHGLEVGSPLGDLTYSKLLDRSLERTRYYLQTDAMGNKTRVTVPLNMLKKSKPFYDAAQKIIDKLTVDLPVSPIDHIRMRMEKAGYKVAEITGREWRIDYSGEIPKLAKRPADEMKNRVVTASRYNNGGYDALIVNQAGSTGISLHPSPKVRDQRPRRMLLGQPAGDVNVNMQLFGRINRTGQLHLPLYTTLAVALPAELRPQINLTKKLKSLNANTSSNTRSAISIKAVDLINKYGDQVIGRYLLDNPDMAAKLRLSVTEGKDGNVSEAEGLAMKATGRSALLPVKEQRVFMDAVTEAYTNEIEFLTETGQNDLEPQTYDYDARETASKVIYRGTNPSSPFGQDGFYNEFSIKRQGKPMSAEEVEALLADSFGPEITKLPEYQRVREMQKQFGAHMEELYKPYEAGITSDANRNRAATVREVGRALLNDFAVGVGLRISINGDLFNAIVTKIEGARKQTGNPYAPSSMQFTVAVNGALRKTKVPGNKMRGTVGAMLGSRPDIKKLFQDVSSDRQSGVKILTGNLIGAYGTLKEGIRGRVISFTMADGTVKQGIQLPHDFEVDKDTEDSYAMRTPEGARNYLQEGDKHLMSNGGAVGVFGPHHNDPGWHIRAVMSRSAGGKYYLDPNILATVVGGGFASSGGMMRAQIKQGQETEALRLIMQKVGLYPPPGDTEIARTHDEKAAQNSQPEPPTSPAGRRLRGSDPTATLSFMGAGYAAKGAEELAEYAKKAIPATLEDVLKAAKLAGRTMKQAGREVVAALYPRALTDADGRVLMDTYKGDQALSDFQVARLLDGADSVFKGMPEEDWIKFLDREMTGEEQTKELKDVHELMQSIMEGQRAAENDAANLGRKKGNEVQLKDRPNYFGLRYKVRPGGEKPLEEGEQIERIAPAKRPLEGSKAFTKQKKYLTASAAKEAGGEFSGNPADMFKQRIAEGMKFVTARRMWSNGRDMGKIRFRRNGTPLRDGFEKVDDKLFRVARPVETEEGGVLYQQTGEWVIEKDYARLVKNYLSRDLVRTTTLGKAVVTLKNASTAAGFAFSPFHWLGTTMRMWSGAFHIGVDQFWNQGVRDLRPGAAMKGLESIGKSIVAPITAVRFGKQFIQYARTPDEFLMSKEGQKFAAMYPELPRHLQGLFRGGMRWGMPEVYKHNLGDGFGAAIREGHLGTAALKAFPWLTDVVNKPLFEHYVPALKWFYAVNLVTQKLDQYAYAIAAGEMDEHEIYRQIASATENQFGELHLENMDWNNTMRSFTQMLFRSSSWKIGTWATAANALAETRTTATQAARMATGGKVNSSAGFDDHIYEKVAEENDGWDSARKWTRRIPELGVNQGSLIALCMTTAVLGTIITKLSTGKWPWELAEELVEKAHLPWLGAMAYETAHPRTGRVDDHGEPIRFSLPSDVKDYEHAVVDPRRYAAAAVADVFSNGVSTLENRDAFQNYVFNPEDKPFTQLGQIVAYNMAGDFEPYSLRPFLPMRATDHYGKPGFTNKLERASGLFGNPPKSFGQSHALNEAIEMRNDKSPHTPLTPEQQVARQDQKPPTHEQIRQAARDKNLDYLQRVVLHDLTYVQAKQIYDDPKTTDQERRELGPIIARKRENMIRAAMRR